MRPTVSEQLLGTCHLLEDVVAPAVDDAYANEILHGLISNLRMLNGAIPAIPPFLAWDNRATADLLREAAGTSAPALAREITETLEASAPDSLDVSALDRRNVRLRALLAAALEDEEASPELRARTSRHLTDRAARSPIRFAMPLPGERAKARA